MKELREMVQNFINVLEGRTVVISATHCKIEDGDIIWDYEDEEVAGALNLYEMDEDQLNDLQSELAPYVLDYLKEEYLNQEIKLLDLDNEMQSFLNLNSNESIFNGDTREYIENSYCYQYQYEPCPSGFNFEFEIVEDDENETKIVVKITNIDTV